MNVCSAYSSADRMLKLVLLFLALSGLQAAPLTRHRTFHKKSHTYRLPDGFRQGTEHSDIRKPIPDDFRQGTEPSRRFIVNLNTGLVQDYVSEMGRRADVIHPSLGNGLGEMNRRHWILEEALEVPAQRNGDGWVRVEMPSAHHLPDGFRQGTEPVKTIPEGFRQGTEPVRNIPQGYRQGTEPSLQNLELLRQGAQPRISLPVGFRQGTEPVKTIPEGFRQGTEPVKNIPEGFRQGTEPSLQNLELLRQGAQPRKSLPVGFRQGTEPVRTIPEGFRQGTEPVRTIPESYRQGTEPSLQNLELLRQGAQPRKSLPAGFRQGTEPVRTIPEGFRQGTEPVRMIPEGFRQGTEPVRTLPMGFRQGTEPSTSRRQTQTVDCKGAVVNGKCYQFNPTPFAFQDAQDLCRALAPNAELASVTSSDLHSRLVSLVTKGGESNPVLTWLGGTVKNQKASWVDGSEWSYSDWMPGHRNIYTDKPVCVEMFMIDQSWWTTAACELKRASICSFPITA